MDRERADSGRRDLVRCNSCGTPDPSVFYRAFDVPVTAPIPRDARPVFGELRIGHCRSCGYVQNTAFDPTKSATGDDYVETQWLSPTFAGFARCLAEHLVARYRLQGARVMEIGSGRGDFLRLMSELGVGTGIGFDPHAAVDDPEGDAQRGITYVRDVFGPRYGRIEAHLVCCRHTLEHISDPFAFLTGLRGALGDDPSLAVVFEVPNTRRILGELAFWDLHYEHCGYWCAESLEYVFRRSGFEVHDVWTDFGDQLLVIEAHPGVDPPGLDGETFDGDRLDAEVANFARRFPERIGQWRRIVDDSSQAGGSVVLWGVNAKTAAFLTAVDPVSRIEHAVDINPAKEGMIIPGLETRVVGPERLRDIRPDLVVVMNPMYEGEVRRSLGDLGLDPTVRSVR